MRDGYETAFEAIVRRYGRALGRYAASIVPTQRSEDVTQDSFSKAFRNLAEFKAGDNPRRADTDRDGTKDGDENAGTITSFEDDVLTINLYNGGSVTGRVTAGTRIKCHKAHESGEDRVSARNQAPGQGGQAGEGPDDSSGNSGPGENSGPGGREHGKQGQCNCSTDNLTAGTVVEEAELELRNGTATFEEIELGEVEDE